MTKTHSFQSKAKEVAEDIFFGQITIIWARWFIIGAGTIVALWSAQDINQLSVGILTVITLMATNFFAHGRYMAGKPVNQVMLLLTNVIDVAVITLLVLFWSQQTGINSNFFIMYYPLLFAFALVFSPSVTSLFTIFTLVLYTAACVVIQNQQPLDNLVFFELLAARILTLGAMGGLGTYYYRRQRNAMREIMSRPVPIFK